MGHCSIEDAKACMELVQLKLEKGEDVRIPSRKCVCSERKPLYLRHFSILTTYSSPFIHRIHNSPCYILDIVVHNLSSPPN